jgi:hypothetical protein
MFFNLVCLARVFFRIPSIRGAYEKILSAKTWEWLPIYGVALQFLVVYALMLFLIDLRLEASNGEYLLETRPLILRVVTGLVFCVLFTLFGANQENAFIYFRF